MLRSFLAASLLTAFTVSAQAQTVCDSLEVIAVHYAAFTDTALEVFVVNHSTELFDYPSFRVVDQAGDTLAVERIDFFGIGWDSPSVHRTDLLPGVQLPQQPFPGTLVLQYTGFPEPEGPCVFPMTFDLCPDSACIHFQPYILNFGGALVTATFNWAIVDMDGLEQGSGTLELDANTQQQDFDDICLPPGHYALVASNPDVTGGQLHFGVTRGMFRSGGPSDAYISGGASNTLPFDLFAPCIEGGNGIAAVAEAPFLLTVENEHVRVRSANGSPLGTVDLLDVHGRLLRSIPVNNAQAALDLQGTAAGTYLVRVRNGAEQHVRRFVLTH